MRAVVQRVSSASLTIDDHPHASIGPGLLILVGVEEADGPADLEWLSGKLVRLRVFPDAEGVMNRSLLEAGGELLVVSQFTLFASTRKGNRPSYARAARPEIAIPLYEAFVQRLAAELGRRVATGVFGAHMRITLTNDGPVTLVIDSQARE